MQNLKENWIVLSKSFHLQAEKNNDCILESKMEELNWKPKLLIYFENCQDVPYSGRVGIGWWTLIIVNITPTCKR